jgi:hypothetical protein
MVLIKLITADLKSARTDHRRSEIRVNLPHPPDLRGTPQPKPDSLRFAKIPHPEPFFKTGPARIACRRFSLLLVNSFAYHDKSHSFLYPAIHSFLRTVRDKLIVAFSLFGLALF